MPKKPKQKKRRTGDFDGIPEQVKSPCKKGYHKGCFGSPRITMVKEERK